MNRRRVVDLQRERGAVTLIAAVLLLTVIVLALNIGLVRVGSDMTDTALLADGVEALSLAESGVERAARLLSAGGMAACSAAGLNAGTSYTLGGRGTFSILSTPAPAAVATECRFQAQGVVPSVVGNSSVRRTLQVDLLPGATPLFTEYFNGSIAGWTQVLINAGGNSAYDGASNCPNTIAPCAPAANTGTGSFWVFTNAGGGNDRITGYRWRTLPTNITTGAAGRAVTVEFGYVKHSSNGNPRAAQIAVVLQEVGGALAVVWTDPALGNAPVCTANPMPPVPANCWTSNQQTVTLPASRTYNRIWLVYDLQERGNNRVSAWFDAVTITDGTGVVSVVRWAEI